MAKNDKKKSGKYTKSKYSLEEQFAFTYGKVKRGLKNPDSLITDSFKKGEKGVDPKQKKTLY
jgi:hypothetical protein